MISTVLWLAGTALVAAGIVLAVSGLAGRTAIRGELSEQRIVFPAADELPAPMARHAGAAVHTGAQARAFAGFIGQNITRMADGRSYSEISDEWIAGGRADDRLGELRQAVFAGQMLRGSLLGAYQAWQVTALVIALGALFAAVGLVFVALGAAWH